MLMNNYTVEFIFQNLKMSNCEIVGAVKAIIYELDTTAQSGVIFLAESDNYTITAQDKFWIDIPFLDPTLRSGFAYEFGIVGV